MGLLTGQEKKGAVLILASSVIWGAFPIVVQKGTQVIPPVTFAALSTIIASLAALVYAAVLKKTHQIRRTEGYKAVILLTIFTIIIPYTLFFWGASMTSATNASILLLAEIIFVVLITPLFGEKTSLYKILGAGGVLLGAVLILYNGTLSLNTGDVIIIASTVSYPIGNFYSKKALHAMDPSMIIFLRFLIGGVFILAFARLVEPTANLVQISTDHLWLLLFNGIILLGVVKVLWYEGFRRIDISKAISLGMTFPVFSLAILILWFNEIPSIYQGFGILLMGAGVYFTLKRKSTHPQKTRYGSL